MRQCTLTAAWISQKKIIKNKHKVFMTYFSLSLRFQFHKTHFFSVSFKIFPTFPLSPMLLPPFPLDFYVEAEVLFLNRPLICETEFLDSPKSHLSLRIGSMTIKRI